MSLGKNINERCKQLGINTKELSELSNVPYTTIRDIVLEKTKPSIDKVERIALALHTTIDRLVYDDELNTDDELKILFIEILKMKQENQKTVRNILKALIVQNKSQELQI
ncbi:MAG: XRE family transcriptional regulator [Moraxella sp.]|nr:MAG: XRE family transcriptional regulator [Moraxella sp.]